MKDSWHQEGLLHLHLDLTLDGEGGFGDGWIPVTQDHLFIEQEYGIGFLGTDNERSEQTRDPTAGKRGAWTHRAGAVAAHTPLRHHALASIDNEDLVLNCDLVFGLDGMFELQHAETRGKA